MKSRFVVTRTTKWAGYPGARHFLKPLVPEWDENVPADGPYERCSAELDAIASDIVKGITRRLCDPGSLRSEATPESSSVSASHQEAEAE